LLHLLIAFLNSSLAKGSHCIVGLNGVLSNRLGFIWWFYAKLNVWYKVYHKLLSSIQRYPLYYNVSIVGIFIFITQFMKSQGLLFFNIISWILLLKNKCLIFLTTPLKIFQSSIILDDLYLVSLLWHFLFYYALEY